MKKLTSFDLECWGERELIDEVISQQNKREKDKEKVLAILEKYKEQAEKMTIDADELWHEIYNDIINLK